MLEFDSAIKEINLLGKRLRKAPIVLVQLPDGLKPEAANIVNYLEKNTTCDCFIWAGSCWGACDIADVKDFDLILHLGHNLFGFEE